MSVTVEDATTFLNLTAEGDIADVELYVDAANGWIAQTVTDTATAAVELATLFLIQHWWRQSQLGPAAFVPDGELVVIGSVGYAIPNRVRELIGPYLARYSPTGEFPDAVAWPDPVERV